MTSNCIDVLNNYADFLNTHTDEKKAGIRPHPLFFTGVNCSGNMWPDFQNTLDPVSGASLNNPSGTEFNSMYIPGGWTVILSGNGTITYPDNTGTKIPALITDVNTLIYPNTGQSLTNNVSTAIIQWPKKSDGVSTYGPGDWAYQMCMNEINTIVGSRHLSSWQAGSPECDTFMNGFCADVATLGCAPNSTEPVTLPVGKEACYCLTNENCLKQTFCEPGSTNPSCATLEGFQEFIPVTCFGKQCSIYGYRWARMQDQRCTITLCQQIISLTGSDIVVRGGSTIWCGNKEVSITPTPTITPTPSNTSESTSLPMWAWVLIGVGIFILCVAIPLAVLVYRQAAQKRIKDTQATIWTAAHT